MVAFALVSSAGINFSFLFLQVIKVLKVDLLVCKYVKKPLCQEYFSRRIYSVAVSFKENLKRLKKKNRCGLGGLWRVRCCWVGEGRKLVQSLLITKLMSLRE